MDDVWAEGESYEPYVGRWSRLTARAFLEWLDPAPGSKWIDVGCGTGALSHAILALTQPVRLLGVDRSPGFVAHARRTSPTGRARFAVGDAQALPVGGGRFDVAVSALVLNFMPRPERMIAEMIRAVRPGGSVALYVWDYAAKMEMIRCFWDAALELDPAAGALDEAWRFPLCQPDALRALMANAGLNRIEFEPIDVATVFGDFADYWSPFLRGQGPAPGYVASLDELARERLRKELERRLPVATDGSIALVARALAVGGRT
ncbi:MAG: methyltransferase domain-containing protein [Gemmatimonadota bacterium]